MVAERVPWTWVRKIGARLTTPLHPDDYLTLINPLWTTRELRGAVEKVIPETDDAATVVIRPGWGWSYDHHPGQYIGIGIQVKGKFHWRSYSVSSPPSETARRSRSRCGRCRRGSSPSTWSAARARHDHPAGAAERRLRAAEPPAGEDPVPGRRQRHHPGDGDAAHPLPARHDARRRAQLLLADPRPDDLPRRDDGARREAPHADAARAAHRHRRDARDEHLDHVCPDWRERETWACGPAPMLDAAEEHWEEAGLEDKLHLERFSLDSRATAARAARSPSATPTRPPRPTVPPP